MTIEFLTGPYLLAHGHLPRGAGYWAFAFGRRDGEPVFIPGPCTYAEAKRQARAIAKERGFSQVWVCS